MSKYYSVLFSKDPPQKKRKIFHDGTMEVLENTRGSTSFKLLLKDEEGNILLQQGEKDIARIIPEAEVRIGRFQVQIESELSVSTSTTGADDKVRTQMKKPESSQVVSLPKLKKFRVQPLHSSPQGIHSVNSVSQSGEIWSDIKDKNQIDAQLLRVMRPHQVVATEFMLERLCNAKNPPSSGVLSSAQVAGTAAACDPDDIRGVVLADEMGLGKSLVSIAVLWHFVKRGKSKGVIVCPSSLVNNWYNEIKKWLGVRLNAIRVRPGASSEVDVRTFVVGHKSMSPVLIISYEMFRKHVNEINSVSQFSVVVCDEGHRLKNVGGTQTSQALSSCVARKRIVLTGSPIQNNFDELYAILRFIAPHHEFGSLSTFKTRMTNRSDYDDFFSKTLGNMILRRTQSQVLQEILPPRKEIVLYLKLSDAQEDQYHLECCRILNGAANCDVVLPGLLRLRQICNATVELPCIEKEGENTPLQSEANAIIETSSKMKLLIAMIKKIGEERLCNSSDSGKVVIVSNFISMLDKVEFLLRSNGWKRAESVLRLDGSVASDTRQGLVDRFNRSNDPSWIFLLAAKAGGVGLNLVGANKVFMMDCDWNPSVDLQAMARVWRQGQRLPVFIYRFVIAGKIEQTVLERQFKKECLSSVFDLISNSTPEQSSGGDILNCQSIDSDEQVPGMSGDLPYVEEDSLQSIIYPKKKILDKVRSEDSEEISAQLASCHSEILLAATEISRH